MTKVLINGYEQICFNPLSCIYCRMWHCTAYAEIFYNFVPVNRRYRIVYKLDRETKTEKQSNTDSKLCDESIVIMLKQFNFATLYRNNDNKLLYKEYAEVRTLYK